MNNNAKNTSCEILMYPTDPKYDEGIREFQGCPTIAISPKGRIFAGWYAGGWREPHMDNYNLIVHSDDDGKTWSKPVCIMPSDRERLIHVLDIQLWMSPEGKLFVFWVQNNVRPAAGDPPEFTKAKPGIRIDGYDFTDFTHAEWCMVCDDPDAEKIVFSEPRYLDIGFLRCKPTVLSSGEWINFNYDQEHDRYGYSISLDKGKSYTHYYGSKKLETHFDEAMAYERLDGSLRMIARSSANKLAESYSFDKGLSWTDAEFTDIDSPNTRIFVSRTPSGRILLVNNDSSVSRCNMSVYLSEDDGASFKYKRLIDSRDSLSYPDVDFYDGKIYLVYDRERCGIGSAREILFTSFTEEDIMNDNYVFTTSIISKTDFPVTNHK